MATAKRRELQYLRDDANNHFRKIFNETKTQLGAVMNFLRITSKQNIVQIKT